MKLMYISPTLLRSHERTSAVRLRAVRKSIERNGLRKPIVVDKNTFVILDGHHRAKALMELGVQRIPVIGVHYFGSSIQVTLRRKSEITRCIKHAVVAMAMSGKLFPNKTTRHGIKTRFIAKPIKLETLY